jgi:hypothetical protein
MACQVNMTLTADVNAARNKPANAAGKAPAR